ncbi:hypothetical protein NKW43_05925 [Gluconobacter albidus]|uniref:hypothetical protein n=1 Tax=Gluconobacter albidus TaxID=318683 RepID=UPI00209DC927|nr:hypothetical protein [Gluconobacter albidus]MCP1273222.1 hypothetical protein [Gluconobacter albidus]
MTQEQKGAVRTRDQVIQLLTDLKDGFTHTATVPEIYDEIRDQVLAEARGAAEAVKAGERWYFSPPEYHPQGMGCGLEDRGIHDRYRAMEYGWDEAVEMCSDLSPEELYTRPANVAALEARMKVLEVENAQLRIRSLPEHLTDPLREVLGRMCFECITLARALRADGMKVPNRAEDEQAAVIFFLLPFVLAHGADWRKHAVEELGAMEARHSGALTREGGE